jgi:hypothetical protein
MKTSSIIEIDVAPLYRELGVNLNESVIASGCVDALRARLTQTITRQMLLEAMLQASKPPKRNRQKKSPATSKEEQS